MRTSKVIATALVLLLAASLVSPASALGIFAQWQDSKDADSGFGFGVKKDFSIIPLIRVEPRVSWLRYSDDSWPDDIDVIPLEVFGKIGFGLLYGGIGVGYYILSGDFAPDDSFGGFGAVGVEFSPASIGVFGEVRYLLLEPDYGDVDQSVDMNGFGVSAGVILPF
jgi:hypothetical protein